MIFLEREEKKIKKLAGIYNSTEYFDEKIKAKFR